MGISSRIGQRVSSFGFSGAGFLTCYHLGVAECLLQRGALNLFHEDPANDGRGHNPVIVTGVSGGALVATAISIGIQPTDGMNIMIDVAEHARRSGGLLDHLKPGFSLVDEVEKRIYDMIRDFDEELVLRRIRKGQLRIGLTDSRAAGRFQKKSDAYVYVDRFESLEEVIAACVLSSYIPGVTGPISHTTLQQRTAVSRAHERMYDMLRRRAIMNHLGFPLDYCNSELDTVNFHPGKIRFLDGGLANVFPTVDESTCIVTPFVGNFVNPTISPGEFGATANGLRTSRQWRYVENAKVMRYVSFPSDCHVLENYFELGFNNASRFLADSPQKSSQCSLEEIVRIVDHEVLPMENYY